MSAIYHITSREALLKARSASPESSGYASESLSREGFIHFSNRDQVLEVADSYYRGQAGLVLLEVDPARLRATLKYEPPVHPVASEQRAASDQLFPHLYGALNLDAITAVYDFDPGVDGRFCLPAALATHLDH